MRLQCTGIKTDKMAGNNEIEDENIYCTQTADKVDIEIFEKIKEHFGQLDKESFIRKVLEQYDGDSEQLNAVRKSMYDYGKSRIEDFPAGHLTERRQRGKTGKTIGENTLPMFITPMLSLKV